MAQLTSDKEAIGHDLMTIEECLRLIRETIIPLNGFETVPLLNAHKLISHEEIKAKLNLPSFNNSAVDGYAINFLKFQSIMRLSQRIIAGDAVKNDYDITTALRIFTGAALPNGFDTVYMQEDVREERGFVYLPQGLQKGANARLIGEDVSEGSIIIKANTVISSRHIALLAACGVNELKVKRKVTVGIFSTGNELKSLELKLLNGQIYDSNRYALQALLENPRINIIDLGILQDNAKNIEQALRAASQKCDIILTSGGVSMGEEDHVKGAVEAIGSLNFWRLGIKPGRPVAIGKINTAILVGLPGNPVAVYVTFQAVVQPIIAALLRQKYEKPQAQQVTIGFDYKKKLGRKEYVRVSIDENIAYKHPQDGAGVISSLTQTDGLLELLENCEKIQNGESVSFIPYRAFEA